MSDSLDVRSEMTFCACACSVGVESGDWLIFGGLRGVENAPVDCFCRASNISCSSLGSRGGAAPALNPPNALVGLSESLRVVDRQRVKRWERGAALMDDRRDCILKVILVEMGISGTEQSRGTSI